VANYSPLHTFRMQENANSGNRTKTSSSADEIQFEIKAGGLLLIISFMAYGTRRFNIVFTKALQ
jgi:hypothetical protein